MTHRHMPVPAPGQPPLTERAGRRSEHTLYSLSMMPCPVGGGVCVCVCVCVGGEEYLESICLTP